jgi:hypothetical protein
MICTACHKNLTGIAECCKSAQDLKAENTKLKEALKDIDAWAKAYPIEVFPEPDWKKAAQVLKDAGITLDAISSHNTRHVLTNLKDIVIKALED